MKRYGNLFSKVVALDNIENAFTKAKKGKSWQEKVQIVEKNKDYYLNKIKNSLINKTFRTSKYNTKMIYEPKQRLIYVLPFFPDRIVQHAIMNVISPIWESMMIHDSYSCRKGKGQHLGSKQSMEDVMRNKYCLQCDISKFYPSISHNILYNIVQKKIKDKDMLWLLNDIIYSIDGGKNVPIGNYTSQWFGNLYLNELDMRVKHIYKIKDYIRYCDDFVLFFNNKKELNEIAKDVKTFLQEKLDLTLSKCSLFHTSQGLDFLGYRHFPNGKILVRKRTIKRLTKMLKGMNNSPLN
jgi:retron-type reverse transcriptase